MNDIKNLLNDVDETSALAEVVKRFLCGEESVI